MRVAAGRSWDEISTGLSLAWQPVYDLASGHIWGYEALSRGPEGSGLEPPAELWPWAAGLGRAHALEYLCRARAWASAPQLLQPGHLFFVNVDPRWLEVDEHLIRTWSPECTVLEVSERQSAVSTAECAQALQLWRARGFRVALDDFGAGYSGLTTLVSLHPDILKVDRMLVEGVDRDGWRQEVLASVLHLSHDLGIVVVAEGIQTQAELETLITLRTPYGEGFHLGRPAPVPSGRPLAVASLAQTHPLRTAPMSERLATYRVDRQRHILAWNGRAQEVTGRGHAEMVGQPCWRSGLDHQDLDGNRLCFRACPLVAAMVQQAPQDAVISLRHAGGTRRWVRVHAEPVLDATGQVVGAEETFVPCAPPAEVAERHEPWDSA